MNLDGGRMRIGLARAAFFAVLVCCLAATNGWTDDKKAKEKSSANEPQDVLTLLEKGVIDVELSAHGAYRLDVGVWNLTKETVRVSFPPGLVADAFGQNEVLAQIRGGGGNGSLGGGSSGSQGMGLIESPSISVAANDRTMLSVHSVCLNYGLPEPTPRSPLFLKRVEEYTANRKVRDLLPQLAQAGAPANVAQYALWHYTNGLTWDQLARIPSHTGNRMTADDFKEARRWASGDAALENSELYTGTGGAKEFNKAKRDAPSRRTSAALAVQINPDPRGGNGAGVVRAVARKLQEENSAVDVSHANALPRDDSNGAVVCWQVLVKAPTGRGSAAYGKPMMMTLVRSDWDSSKQKWKRDRPRSIKVSADDAGTLADVADAVDRQLMQEIAGQAVTATYVAAKRELTLVNTLPVSVTICEIKPRRDATKAADFKDLIVPAYGKKTIAVADKLPHEPGRTLQPVVSLISLETGKA